MKSLLFLPLLFIAPAVLAQEQVPVAVAPATNRQITLTLPKGQPALVRDQRSVTLPSGRSALRFPEVPSSGLLDRNSLQLSIAPVVSVLRQDNGTIAAPGYDLAAFVGKQVSLIRPQWEVGGNGKTISGTLLSAEPTRLLETAEGVLVNPGGIWVLPREGKERLTDSGFRGVQWQVESMRAGDFPTDVTYATAKLTWDARYTATLSPTNDRLNLRGWLVFGNDTQTVYPNAKISLREGNDTTFAWPRPATINTGETQLAYVGADVPVTERLIFDTQTASKFLAPLNDAHPNRSMTLENSTTNGLGFYLPTGSLSLWQGQDEKTLSLDKTANWGGFAAGDLISVPLGANPDIYIDRSIISSKLLNPVTREVTISWKVESRLSSRDVTLIDNLPSRFKLTNSTLKPVSEINDQLRFEIKVATDKPVEFRYTIEIPA